MTKEEAFKDWGNLNTLDYKGSPELKQQYKEANELHEKDKKEHPEDHDQHEVKLGRSYYGYPCKCGYNETVDMGD